MENTDPFLLQTRKLSRLMKQAKYRFYVYSPREAAKVQRSYHLAAVVVRLEVGNRVGQQHAAPFL